MTTQIISLIILLVLSAFFSSSETAFFSISRTKARHMAKTRKGSFLLIESLKEDPHRLLTTILIGNNTVNVAAASLATALALQIFPSHAVGIVTGIMTLLILVFGEVFPKSLATRNNIGIARMAVYPIYWLSILLFPVLKFLAFIPLITGKVRKSPRVTEEELLTIVEAVEEEGSIKEEERKLIYNIFEFDDTNASEIMTPRADMFIIDINKELNLKEILESGYTRVPVIDGDIDHVIGIINIKDLFLHTLSGGGKMDIRKIMRAPFFVPEHKKLDKLLQQFKKRRHHMAILVDEHGGVSGLITLEDALEEIFGDIADETDKEEPHIIKAKAREWIVLGKADIEEVNQKIPLRIPESNDYDTFSGYILEKIGRLPTVDEEIPIDGFTVTVKEIDGIRITKYLVRQNQPQEPATMSEPAVK
ncbi:MAG: hemolysin family protein [Desulfobacterales bacterium]